jgi:hypothetical protein
MYRHIGDRGRERLVDDGHLAAAISNARTNCDMARFAGPLRQNVRLLRYSSAIASCEDRRLEALAKNCHLLPSTAILYPQNRYDRCNRSIVRTTEGSASAVESLGFIVRRRRPVLGLVSDGSGHSNWRTYHHLVDLLHVSIGSPLKRLGDSGTFEKTAHGG